MAYDRGARIGYLVVSRWPTMVRLIPRAEFREARREGTFHGARAEHTAQQGTPYGMARFELEHNGRPCLKGPWSTLAAVDLDVGEVLWQKPVGYIVIGGPLVTEGVVVFLALNNDKTLRAFSGADGSELWTGQLPAGGHATPMSYRHEGVDYVVVAAGGDLAAGRGRGDHLVAFRLPVDAP